MKSVVDGTEKGPARDMTLLNAAAALLACDRVSNMEEGVQAAADSIDDGSAMASLEKLALVSNS